MNLLNKSKIATVFFGGFLCGAAYLVSCGQVNINSAGAGGSATRYVKANGTSIGEFLSISDSLSESGGDNLLQVFVAISATGYIIPIRRNGEIDRANLLFSSGDCTGQGYVQSALNKSVFRCHASIFYVAPAAEEFALSPNSRISRDTGVCEAYTSSPLEVVPAQANNGAITGVSSNSFSTPITIE